MAHLQPDGQAASRILAENRRVFGVLLLFRCRDMPVNAACEHRKAVEFLNQAVSRQI